MRVWLVWEHCPGCSGNPTLWGVFSTESRARSAARAETTGRYVTEVDVE